MKNLITYTAIVLCAAMMLLGCYSQKKASKHLLKVQTSYPAIVSNLCSSLYPPLAFTKDSIVFLKGDVEEEIVYVEVDCDSVLRMLKEKEHKIVRVPCPPSVYRTDTLLVYKEKQVVDRAAIHTLNSKLEEVSIALAKTDKENYILIRVAIILGLYTLLRWVLRIWHIKLP